MNIRAFRPWVVLLRSGFVMKTCLSHTSGLGGLGLLGWRRKRKARADCR